MFTVGERLHRLAGGRTARAMWWVFPSFLCLLIYYPGLLAWFQADDFVWLGQWRRIADGGSLWTELLAPSVHGTWRPLSERAYFLVLSRWFPEEALPFRMVAFATQFLNLALLAWLVRRLSGSAAMGFLAALLWLVNPNLGTVMSWSSAYMQALCGFCLLAGFHFYLNWVETGRRRWYGLQWLVFLTGFLVMETTVVYPALIAVHALLFHRRRLLAIAPMFAASAAFAILHILLAPKQAQGVYSMHFDGWILVTLARYVRLAVSPSWTGPHRLREWAWNLPFVALVSLALLASLWWGVRKRQWQVLVFAAWFLFPLAPVLPLRDHVTHYYLTLPAIGLAMLGAWGLVEAWRSHPVMRWSAAAIAAVFAAGSANDARAWSRWYYQNSVACREIIACASAGRKAFPNKMIFLNGLSDDNFWRTFVDHGFQAFRIDGVYPTPEVQGAVIRRPDYPDIDGFFCDADTFRQAMESRTAVVLDYNPGSCRNITTLYIQQWERNHSRPQDK